jgi:hypothetical protein
MIINLAPISFRDWVMKQEVHRNACGDFIFDAKADSRFPDIRCWPELRDYLHSRGACHMAVEAGRKVWRAYFWLYGEHPSVRDAIDLR